jgi:hypothetical protein
MYSITHSAKKLGQLDKISYASISNMQSAINQTVICDAKTSCLSTRVKAPEPMAANSAYFEVAPRSCRSNPDDAKQSRIGQDLTRFTEKLKTGYSEAKIRIFRQRVWREFHAEFDVGGLKYIEDPYFNPELSAEEFLFFRYYMTNYKVPVPNGVYPSAVAVSSDLASTHMWAKFSGEYSNALLAGNHASTGDLRR